jgi:hypothetical protein
MAGKSDGAWNAVNDEIRRMMSTESVIQTLSLGVDIGMPLATVVDTYDTDAGPDDDANYTCDACHEVSREGLNRMISCFECVTPPRGHEKGRLVPINAHDKTVADLVAEASTRPRAILVIYLCESCALEIARETGIHIDYRDREAWEQRLQGD